MTWRRRRAVLDLPMTSGETLQNIHVICGHGMSGGCLPRADSNAPREIGRKRASGLYPKPSEKLGTVDGRISICRNAGRCYADGARGFLK